MLIFALLDELSRKEKRLLSENQWSISSIVIWEISKLMQMQKIDLEIGNREFGRIINSIHTWPINLNICMKILDLDIRSDPADEIIAATSVHYGVPLVTRDKKLRKSKIIPFAK